MAYRERSIQRRARKGPPRALPAVLVIMYVLVVLAWAIAHRIVGDGYWLLGLFNGFALYLFVPLPFFLLLALWARSSLAWAGYLIIVLLFLGFFGAEIMPPLPSVWARRGEPPLTVMTDNVLHTNWDIEAVVRTVREVDPDVIAFQEMTHLASVSLENRIGEAYPHRAPLLSQCYSQAAVWSRYPLQAETTEEDMVCRVRPVLIDYQGQRVRLVNIHAWPYVAFTQREVERSFSWRRAQIDDVVAGLKGQPQPLIVLGDMNSTQLHDAYRVLVRELGLRDAFRHGGWGFGHTYPTTPGRFYNVPYPPRLVRIDHILHSPHWRTAQSWVAPWDGQSDHMSLVARLYLVEAD